jgi:hypothetical protein
MKNATRGLLLIALLAGLWMSNIPLGYAQGTATPTPIIEATAISPGPDAVSFETLGESDIFMYGPYDNATIPYMLPPSWALQDGASLTLIIDSSSSESGQTDQSPSASLEVSLNNYLVETILINWTGLQTVNVVIPAVALPSTRPDGRQELSFFLDASSDCNFSRQTTVVLRSNSFLSLPHSLVPPATDLLRLPSPIFQRYAFQVVPAVLVVPANPTADELKAALSIAAGFGRASLGELELPLVPLNLLTDQQKQSSHIIFVGKASSLQSLNAVRFPVEVLPQGLSYPSAQTDDGYVQMAVSPWNQSGVILYAGGNTDAGVIKAAQAVSTGIVQPGVKSNLSIISSVDASVQVPPVAEDRTLANMGYATREISGYGQNTNEYHFYIPPGQEPGIGPYLNFVYTHSALLDFDNSGFVVSLNDQRIGSMDFTKETAVKTNTVRFDLPKDVLRTGDNKLLILADLEPLNFCSLSLDNNLWFSMSNASLLHMPLIPAQAGIASELLNLSQYTTPLLKSPTLNTIGFVLGKQNPSSWNVAASLASFLGRRATGQILAPEVVFADNIADDFLKTHDLVVVGRPSQLPILAAMTDAMPAPFEPGKDQAVERNLSITYRLAPDASIGYIQIFASPYESQHVILTVLGSTDEALTWVNSALTVSNLRGKLAGNYAVVNHEQILTADTRLGSAHNISATAVPGAVPTVAVLSGTPVQTPASLSWVFPAIVAISLATVVLLIVVAVLSYRNNASQKQ